MVLWSGKYKAPDLINLSCLKPFVVCLSLEEQINDVSSLDILYQLKINFSWRAVHRDLVTADS